MFNIKSLFVAITGIGDKEPEEEECEIPEEDKIEEIPSERGRGRKNVINRSNIKKRDNAGGRKRCLSAGDNQNTFASKFIEKYQNKGNAEFLETKKLPEGFANEVLDLEMQIEGNSFDIEAVNRLIFLYSQAIEVYEGNDQVRYQNFYKKLQNLVNKPSVHQEMKSKPEEKPKKKLQKKVKESFKPKTINSKKMQMDILLMQEESAGQNKSMVVNHDKEEQARNKLIESDMRSQSFNLEKRLAARRFSQNKRVLKRSNSNSTKDNSSSIGMKEDSSEEYSSILNNSKMEDSWNMESKMLLSNLQNVNTSAQLYNFS